MNRSTITSLSFLIIAPFLRADAFDNYTLPILQKVPEFAGAKLVEELTPEMIVQNSQVLPGIEAAFIVVYTNDNRWAKLQVVAARHKLQQPGMDPEYVPMLRIERFVTFREGSERAMMASGQNLSLFPGFLCHLDLGQVVPAKLGGDLTVSEPKPKQLLVKPVGKAKIYLMTKPMPEAAPKGTQKLTVGDKFESSYFNGTYKIYDDGRRSGVLRLKVNGDDVTGTFVSDQNGREYDLEGAVAKPNHKIIFVVKLPQTQQTYEGFMFTGNGKAIAGSSKLQDREAGFYAVRVE
jgi:hypothetical protein